MRRILLMAMLCCLSFVAAYASDQSRYDAFTHGLRCLKCEHQSIAESDSDFAKDVKAFVAQAIQDGRSDSEIKDMLKQRFGDRIFLDPPFQLNTLILWSLPAILCLVGLLIWLRNARIL
jgi:cytochrome c-type biogenesis protein CcmH/NrfF